ncbi:MAG: hypothetical protein AAFU61_11845 [Pseudomonadota bacterium]
MEASAAIETRVAMGCAVFQGFALAPPMPAEEAPEILPDARLAPPR